MLANRALWAVSLGLLAGVASPVQAQSKQEALIPKLNLQFTGDGVEVQGVRGGSIFYPIRCDQEGNIYFESALPPAAKPQSILKISQEGKRLAEFSLQAVPGFDAGEWYGFNVGLRGELYLVAARQNQEKEAEFGIIEFSPEGRFRSATPIEERFRPRQVAAFLSGEFLISGIQEVRAEGEGAKRIPYTVIVDRSGRSVAKVSLPEDVDLNQKPSSTKTAGQSVPAADPISAIDLGNAVAGADGNIYLVRHGPSPKVYVISPAGAVLRNFQVDTPVDGALMFGVQYVVGNRLVFDFGVKLESGRGWQQIISLVDGETGGRLYDYYLPEGRMEVFSCYSPNRFVFLIATSSRLPVRLRVASPR